MDQDSSTTPPTSGDESDNMPRPHSGSNRLQPPKRPELDLSAMLNGEQAKQLQILVYAILDDMQLHVRNTFDKLSAVPSESSDKIELLPPVVVCVPNPRSEKYREQYGDIDLPGAQPDTENREALRAIMKASYPPRSSQYMLTLPSSPEEATENTKKTATEIIVASLSELKRDVLGHFGKWRIMVSKRMGDIVIKSGGTGGNVVGQGPQHLHQFPGNARRGGIAARGRPTRPPGIGESGEKANAAVLGLHPPMYTALKDCPKEKRALILHSMLLLVLGMDQYIPYSRILLLKLATSLQVPPHVLSQDEYRVSQALAQIVRGIPADEIAQKRSEEGRSGKRWRSASGITSAASACATGQLAASLIAAGIGTVFGGVGLGTSATANLLAGIGMAESTVAVGTLFGLYGARQGGKMIDAYAKDIQDFAWLPMHGPSQSELIDPKDVPAENRRMRVTIGVSGWTTNELDHRQPWRVFGQGNEVYALRWELEALSKMGNALDTFAKSMAWSAAKQEIIGRSVFTSLLTSYWPMGLLQASKVIDNPWTVGMVRAEKAGMILAEVLMNKIQGERAVSLVGFSLGARIIYSCLLALAEKRAFGLVENVVMLGAPCPTEITTWAAMKSVVAGRLVNVFSKNDYLLGFFSRTCNWTCGIAGLQEIEGIPFIENLDVGDQIGNHFRYQYLVGPTLKKLNWEDIEYCEVDHEEQKLTLLIDEEAKLDQERLRLASAKPVPESKGPELPLRPKHNKKAKAKGKKTGRGKAAGKENQRSGQGKPSHA